MKHPLLATLLALSGMNLLGGCAPVIVGGAATGSAVIADERTSGSFLDDEAIEVKATLAVADDKSLTDVHINVTSINGVVLLTGEAPTEAQRTKVLEHVRALPRVRRTVNEIRIAPPTSYGSRMSDTLITAKVKSKMIGDEKVNAINIKVVTEYGVVYLMGLTKKASGDYAAELVRQVDGVQKVVKLFEYTD